MGKVILIFKVLIAGILGGVLTSLALWVFDLAELFKLFSVPLSVPANIVPWMIERVIRDLPWALLLLLPLRTDLPQWQRGLVLGLGPGLVLLFFWLPAQGFGLMGLRGGLGLPLFALGFSLLWGSTTGYFLVLQGVGRRIPQDEEWTS